MTFSEVGRRLYICEYLLSQLLEALFYDFHAGSYPEYLSNVDGFSIPTRETPCVRSHSKLYMLTGPSHFRVMTIFIPGWI